MIRHLKIFWKMMVLVIIIPLAVATTTGIALTNAGELKYEYDNLYGFMLIPIVGLDEANLARESLEGNLRELTQSDISADRRAELIQAIKEDDAEMMAVVAKYEAEWVTTLSPEFSAALVRLGRQELQAEEAGDLIQIHVAYEAYAAKRDAMLSGSAAGSSAIDAELKQMETAFNELVKVNLVFAELSNESAQAAIINMRQSLYIVSSLLTLIGLWVAYYISRSIINPINQLRVLAEKISLGDLSATMNIDSKDEIGDLAQAFGRMVASVKFLMAEETSKE